MCQIIVKPAGVTLHRRTLESVWWQNPDGAGYAFREANGDVLRARGFFAFKDFWASYRDHREKDCLIHFRIATHGSKCLENCHPFDVASHVVMAHNGVLTDFTPNEYRWKDKKGKWRTEKDDRSDTRIFVEDHLAPALRLLKNPEEWLNPTNVSLLESFIGWNKLAFLSPKGFTIVNEAKGDWSDGVWYSAGAPWKQRYTSVSEEDTEMLAAWYGEGFGGSTSFQRSIGQSNANEAWLRKEGYKLNPDGVWRKEPVNGSPQTEVLDRRQDRPVATPSYDGRFGYCRRCYRSNSHILTDGHASHCDSDEAKEARLVASNSSTPKVDSLPPGCLECGWHYTHQQDCNSDDAIVERSGSRHNAETSLQLFNKNDAEFQTRMAGLKKQRNRKLSRRQRRNIALAVWQKSQEELNAEAARIEQRSVIAQLEDLDAQTQSAEELAAEGMVTGLVSDQPTSV